MNPYLILFLKTVVAVVLLALISRDHKTYAELFIKAFTQLFYVIISISIIIVVLEIISNDVKSTALIKMDFLDFMLIGLVMTYIMKRSKNKGGEKR